VFPVDIDVFYLLERDLRLFLVSFVIARRRYVARLLLLVVEDRLRLALPRVELHFLRLLDLIRLELEQHRVPL
jgi:hypothetical protein